MDRTRVELIGPMILTELRREAERERAVAAVPGTGKRGLVVTGAVGRLLVRAGRRLEEAGAARPPVLRTESCAGGGD